MPRFTDLVLCQSSGSELATAPPLPHNRRTMPASPAVPADDFSDLPRSKIPKHIAVIMDGNGRWAVRRGLERVRGHQQGARVVRDVVTECARLRREFGGPDFLTLYSFSLENWKRPADEVTFLMQMYID